MARILSSLVFVLSIAVFPQLAGAQQAVFGILEDGTWGLTDGEGSCADNPKTFRFSEDRQSMWISWAHEHDPVLYHVLYVEGMSLTTLIEGETRRTDAGDRVLWVLRVEDDRHFCWRRTDWPAGSCTKGRVKCVPTS